MARVMAVPAHKAGLFGRLAYRYSRRQFGKVVEPLAVMAHHPRLLLGSSVSELALGRLHLVDDRLKGLVQIKAATVIGCEFCIDIASALGRGTGVTEQQLRALPNYEESDVFSPLEKLALRYAVAMTRTPATIPDELFDALRDHFSDAQLAELTAVIAQENFRARFNHAFGIGSQGLSEGAYCPMAEKPAQLVDATGTR